MIDPGLGALVALVQFVHLTSWEAQLERERRGLAACASHVDGLEGLHAFVEKRPPHYNR